MAWPPLAKKRERERPRRALAPAVMSSDGYIYFREEVTQSRKHGVGGDSCARDPIRRHLGTGGSVIPGWDGVAEFRAYPINSSQREEGGSFIKSTFVLQGTPRRERASLRG